MATVLPPPAQSVILHNLSWETYEHLLADLENSSAPRLTYDRGTLEIMSPLPEHERSKQNLTLLVDEVTGVWEVEVDSLGSTTFKREDLERGFEPDACFYIQNAERVIGKSQIDLRVDPPPDLVIEIDITSPSLNKLPIFAQLGVPEVWRYDRTRLAILVLVEGSYKEQEDSIVLPPLSAPLLTTFVSESRVLKRTEWRRKVREWAQANRSPGSDRPE